MEHLLAEIFVFPSHIIIYSLENCNFCNEVNPRLHDEQGSVEDKGARVEGQDVCPLHERKTSCSKGGTLFCRKLVCPDDVGTKSLEGGCALFLGFRIALVEKEE